MKKDPSGLKFNSTHNVMESEACQGVKIYKQKNLNEFEQTVKNQLSLTGTTLALGDIYKQLEQDFEGEKKFQTSKNQELTLVEDLDVWAEQLGKNTKLKPIQKHLSEVEAEKQAPVKKDNIVENILSLKKYVKSARKSIINNQVTQDLLQKFKNFQQKGFDDQFKKSVDQVHKIAKHRKGVILTDDHRGVQRKINQYMNTMIIEDELDESKHKLGDNKLDITPQGIENTLKQLMSLAQFKPQQTLQEKARFYEKQTKLLSNLLVKKQAYYDNLQNNKINTLRILRIQNNSNLNKIRFYQIKISEFGKSDTKKVQRTQNSSVENFMIKQNLENNKLNYQQNMSQIQKQMNDNSYQINEIEKEIVDIKENLALVQKSNRLLFFSILKEGKDFREEGISWIIKQQWNMGENIQYDHLPSFLDDNSKEFILKKSRLEQEIQEISAMMNIQLDIYKQNLPPDDKFQNTSSIFSQIDISRQKVNIENLSKTQSHLMSDFQSNYYGIGEKQVSLMNKNIEQIFKCKKTKNDIYYKQAQYLVRQSYLQQRTCEPTEPNLQQRTCGPTEPSNTEFCVTTQSEFLPFNKIELYENEVLVNDCKSKHDIFILYSKLKNQIESKQHDLRKLETEELSRLIKKLTFQNYEKKYNKDGGIILGSLFGAFRAERDLIKNGLQRKYSVINN